MKKGIVVAGSVDELMDVVAAEGCKGNIGDLLEVFPEHLHCHNVRHHVPVAMAKAVTPYHTRHMTHAQHVVCELNCGRACQKVDSSKKGSEFVSSTESFKLGLNEMKSRQELLAAGQFVPASEGLYL